MFEKLIWSVVEFYAHKYLQGFSTEAMKIDWWNGKMALDNVELNTKEIAALNLPLHITQGFIHQLSIEIPWSRILSDPVRVYIKGLEIEITPNARYKPEPKTSIRKSKEEIAGYLSILRDQILDNLEVHIDLAKISFCDSGGKFSSIMWITCRKIQLVNLKQGEEPEAENEYCAQCGGGYDWTKRPLLAKDNMELKKSISIQGISVHLEEIGNPRGIGTPPVRRQKGNHFSFVTWNHHLEKENIFPIIENMNCSILLSIAKLPEKHIHFCLIECTNSIDINLRDIDIQAFTILLNELRCLFLKPTKRKEKAPTVPQSSDEDSEVESSTGMMSWMSSTFSGWGGSWFSSQPRVEKATEDMQEEEEVFQESLEEVEELMEDQVDIKLTEEERSKLELIQSQIESEIKEPAKGNSSHSKAHHIYVRIHSIKCHLTQHVEYADYVAKRFIVAPRPLLRFVIDDIRFHQVTRVQQTRIHVSVNAWAVEDLWSESTLFPEILQSPISSFYNPSHEEENKHPAFHAHFFADSRHSVLPSLNIQMESIQLACPPVVLRQISVFYDTILSSRLPSSFVQKNIKAESHDVLLNEISNWTVIGEEEESEEEDYKVEAHTEAPTKLSTSISVEMKQISIVVCFDFSKEDTDLIVLQWQTTQLQQLAHFHPQNSNELVTTYESNLSQVSLYTTGLPSYLCGSLTDRFYYVQPFDCEASIRISKLFSPSGRHPRPLLRRGDDGEDILPFSGVISCQLSVYPIFCAFSSETLNTLRETVDKSLHTFSRHEGFPAPSSADAWDGDEIFAAAECTWKPLCASIPDPNEMPYATYSFAEVQVTCAQSTIQLLGGTSGSLSEVAKIIGEDISISHASFRNIENRGITVTTISLESCQCDDGDGNAFLCSDSSQLSPYFFTGISAFSTPLFTSFTESPDIFSTPQSSLRLTPLQSAWKDDSATLLDTHQTPRTETTKKKRESALNVKLSTIQKPIAGVSNLQMDISFSHWQMVYKPQSLAAIRQAFPSRNESSLPSIQQRLKSLSREELLWQILYVKIANKIRDDFKEKAMRKGAPCLRYRNWSSWVTSSKKFKPPYSHWLSLMKLEAYQKQFPEKVSITISKFVLSLPGPSHQMDVVVPLLHIETARDGVSEKFIFSRLPLQVRLPSLQVYLASAYSQQPTVDKEDSILYSESSDDSQEDSADSNEANQSHTDNKILSLQGFHMSLTVDSNPYIHSPSANLSFECEKIKSDVSPQDCIAVFSILQSSQPISSTAERSSAAQRTAIFQMEGSISQLVVKQRDSTNQIFSHLLAKHVRVECNTFPSTSCTLSVKVVRLREMKHKKSMPHNEIIICPTTSFMKKRTKESNNQIRVSVCQSKMLDSPETNEHPLPWHICGELSGYDIHWIPSFAARERDFIDQVMNGLDKKSNSETSSNANYSPLLQLEVFGIKNLNLTLSNDKHGKDKAAAKTHIGEIQLSSTHSRMNANVNDFFVSIENKNINTRAVEVESFKGNFDMLSNHVTLDCTGLTTLLSADILRVTKSLLRSFSTKSKTSAVPTRQESSPHAITIECLLRRSSLLFAEEEKSRVRLFFSLFQILYTKNEGEAFLSLAYDEGEASVCEQEWIKALHGFPVEHSLLSELPGVLSTAAGYCAWIWKENATRIELHFAGLDGNFKYLLTGCQRIQSIFSRGLSRKSNEDSKDLVQVEPNAKQLANKQTEYSIKVSRIAVRYSTYLPSELHKESALVCRMEEVCVSLRFGVGFQVVEGVAQYAALLYSFKKHSSGIHASVPLLEVFGNTCQLAQGVATEGKLMIDCTAMNGKFPLPLIAEVRMYVIDLILLLQNIQHKSKQEDSRSSFQLYRGNIIRTLLDDPVNKLITNGPSICFSHADFVGLTTSGADQGFHWKGDDADVSEKAITWSYGSPHRMRRICWMNEGYAPRSSVVILQSYDVNTEQFIDILSPIESNCAKDLVSIVIDHANASTVWRLLFKQPEKYQQEVPWPWISAFQIYSNPVSPKRAEDHTPTCNILRISFHVGKSQLALTSSMRSSGNILFLLTCQQVDFDALLSNHKQRGVQISSFLSVVMTVSYQDFARMCMKKFIAVSPRIYIAYSPTGQIAFSIEHEKQVRINLTRTSLQLIRNLSSYLTEAYSSLATGNTRQLAENMAMFHHFRIHNLTGYNIVLTEVLGERILSHQVRIAAGEAIYWKWSLISDFWLHENTNNERGVMIQHAGGFSLPRADISSLGEQILHLHNRKSNQQIQILLRVQYPSQCNSTITATSKILEAQLIAANHIHNDTSIPLQILLPQLGENQDDRPDHAPQIRNISAASCGQEKASPTQSVYFSMLEGECTECTFRFREKGIGEWKTVSLTSMQYVSSQLVRLRKLNEQNEQYVWVNVKVSLKNGFSHKEIVFSPVFILRNNISLPLRWKISCRGHCISEGMLGGVESIALYHSPRRKTFLHLTSGTVALNSCSWSAPYELTRYRKDFSVEMESGIGIWMSSSSPCSVPLSLTLQSRILTASNTREICIQIPCVVFNRSDEGIFVAEVESESFIHQVYIPPHFTLPFPCLGVQNNSTINIFQYKEASMQESHSLRTTSAVPPFCKLIGINTQSDPGVYNAGFCSQEDDNGNIRSHQYLLRVLPPLHNDMRMEVYSPFLFTNELAHPLLIEQVWPTDFPPHPCHHDDLATSIRIAPGQTVGLHHWISQVPILYTGREKLSFCMRYEGAGWEETECSLSSLASGNLFHFFNSLTQQHDRVKVLLVDEYKAKEGNHSGIPGTPLLQGQCLIRAVSAPPFPLSFINFMEQGIYVSVKESEKEIKVCACSSYPLDIPLTSQLSIAIKLSKTRMWSDYMVIGRSRSILLSLFGPKGSEAVHISVQYAFGSSSVYFRSFNRSPIAKKVEYPISEKQGSLGHILSNTTIPSKLSTLKGSHPTLRSLKHLHSEPEKSSSVIHKESKEFLRDLFPTPNPGLHFWFSLPSCRITFTGEKGNALMEVLCTGLQVKSKFHLPQNHSVSIDAHLDSLTLQNCQETSHFPLLWGNCDETARTEEHPVQEVSACPAIQLKVNVPFPFEGHIQKISCKISPVYITLSGPFVANILQHSPAWISAIRYPTQISRSHSPKTPPQTKVNTVPKIFVDQWQISPWQVDISWSNLSPVEHSLLSLPQRLFSVSHLLLQFSEVSHNSSPRELKDLSKQMAKRYIKDVLWQIMPAIGSIDLLGNPTQMIRQIRFYFLEYLRKTFVILRNPWAPNQLGLATHTTSFLFGIMASLVNSCVCFTRAVRDAFCDLQRLQSLQNSAAEFFAESASDQFKVFLHTARMSLEEATRNTIAHPVEGYQATGIAGLVTGTQKALSGWSVPFQVGLEAQLQVLRFLHKWLLKDNSLGEFHRSIRLPSLPPPEKTHDNKFVRCWKEIIIPWKGELPGGGEQEEELFHCHVKKVTFQYRTEILHERVLILSNQYIYLVNSSSLLLAVPLYLLQEIEAKGTTCLHLRFAEDETQRQIVTDAIRCKRKRKSTASLLSLQVRFPKQKYYSSFLLSLFIQYQKKTGHTLASDLSGLNFITPHNAICLE